MIAQRPPQPQAAAERLIFSDFLKPLFTGWLLCYDYRMSKTKLALVTGASQGVGREIANILAKKGWNLLIVARSKDKLEALQQELGSKYAVSVDCYCTDLSQPVAAQQIFEYCVQKAHSVDLLVNNAGAGLFGESVELGDKALSMLNLNVLTLTALCAVFGKDMKERKSGSILNIGSIAGNQPTAYFASYAASKSYVFNYSLALRQELRPYGVNVTCVQPGYIRTNFDNSCNIKSEAYKRFSYKNGMTAQAVAACAVKAVLAKRSFVRAGFANKCAAFFSGMMPRNALAAILALSVRNMTKDSSQGNSHEN